MCFSKPCKLNVFKIGMKSLSLILPIASTVFDEIIIFEDDIWFLTKFVKQCSTNVIAINWWKIGPHYQKKKNFVKGSTWLKCSDMCVAHILANLVYYVKLNMNNCQWKLEGIRTWQPKWQDCKTTNIKKKPLDYGKINVGWQWNNIRHGLFK